MHQDHSIKPDHIIKPRDIKEVAGISYDTAKRLAAVGEFPRLKRLSPRRLGWSFNAVQEWLEERDFV